MDSRLSIRAIEGRHHPVAKKIRAMARSGELCAEGLVLLETERLLQEALACGLAIPTVLLDNRMARRFQHLLPQFSRETVVYRVASKVFETLTTTETSAGILALASAPQWEEKDLLPPERNPLILVLAGLQDPGNLGTILRTAEAFGTTGALLTRGTVSPYNAKAIRASAGSLFRLPVLTGFAEPEVLALLDRHGVRLFSCVPQGGADFIGQEFTGPMALALGSEGAGFPAKLMAAGQPLAIPMARNVESLNVAVAAAVLVYEVARQRNFSAPREAVRPTAVKRAPGS